MTAQKKTPPKTRTIPRRIKPACPPFRCGMRALQTAWPPLTIKTVREEHHEHRRKYRRRCARIHPHTQPPHAGTRCLRRRRSGCGHRGALRQSPGRTARPSPRPWSHNGGTRGCGPFLSWRRAGLGARPRQLAHLPRIPDFDRHEPGGQPRIFTTLPAGTHRICTRRRRGRAGALAHRRRCTGGTADRLPEPHEIHASRRY